MDIQFRPDWDNYFMAIADAVSMRSTCLAIKVGAVIVSKQNRIIATGYNGAPPGEPHCYSQGFCRPNMPKCGKGSVLPSRAVHAERNAITQMQQYDKCFPEAKIYVTLAPCLKCFNAIQLTTISEIIYRDDFCDDISYLTNPHKRYKSNLVVRQLRN